MSVVKRVEEPSWQGAQCRHGDLPRSVRRREEEPRAPVVLYDDDDDDDGPQAKRQRIE
jgi:hypothetical protein